MLAVREAELEQAEGRLAEARQSAGLDNERATLAERWGELSIPERRRALQAFGTTVYVTRGKQPVADRVLLTFSAEQYRGAATDGDFEPEIVVKHEFYDDGDESEPVSWDDEPGPIPAPWRSPASASSLREGSRRLGLRRAALEASVT